ncbi:MAG: restriction endonuclease subunit S [Burkholderiales bacterium]
MSKQEKKGLVPALRFPEFRDESGWDEDKLSELVTTVTPPKKLPTNLYQEAGQYPIIDQSQSNICGWTNDKESLISDNFPLIIFGDHTCILKIAREPFAQGADGIKILKAKDQVEAEFLYQALQVRSVVMEEYKRHFSILKERNVRFPEKESGEQQKISDCLTSVDELITAETQKLDTLKTHKKGLMQQLFPAEGETVPICRFPEFRDKRGWDVKRIEDASEKPFSGGTPSSTNKKYYGGTIPFIRSAEIDKNKTELFLTEEGLKNSSAKLVKKGDVLVALYGANSGDVALGRIDGAINQAILCLRSKTNNAFLYQYLSYKKQEIISTYLQGGQGNLSGDIIKSIELQFPGSNEQQKIADCLSSIDELISNQAQKVKALKAHKKGLMQQLFPDMNEVVA